MDFPMTDDYVERVYAGLLGKSIGIRLGAPVEPAIWTYERIRDVYGDITSYLKPYRNFAADDDANGPIYFIRPLLKKIEEAQERGCTTENLSITPLEIAAAWLNYSREGIGMFWWGGYGRSTEHTAYLNLKYGISAPESGSIARNGRVVAEQIGGQIFIDTWGLVWPGNPQKAAQYAACAASVSHDGEGLHGARFIAGCIAAAFQKTSMAQVVEEALLLLPPDCAYAQVVQAVRKFHDLHPDNWRACQTYLIDEWGYDKWPGACHIIPNAGVCVLALLYGENSFARTVEIATMCGWDTDCNAGNVGTIAGVLYGLDSLPPHYRLPIHDTIVLSGLPGVLNVIDIPTFSRRLAAVGYVVAGKDIPQSIKEPLSHGDGEKALYFDFSLPGSTHGMRVSNPISCTVSHREVLEFRFERLERGKGGTCFLKTQYRRSDFDDERYSPVFSPLARPGQQVEIVFSFERWEGQDIGVEGYVQDTYTQEAVSTTSTVFPKEGKEYHLAFTIPSLNGSFPDEVGLKVTSFSGQGKRDSGRILIRRFTIAGKASYEIDLSKQAVEFGCVTPFSHNGGAWSIEENRLHVMTPTQAASYTGGYRVGDQRVSATVNALAGDCHMLIVRASGAQQGYWCGFDGLNKAAIYKQDFGFEKIAETDYNWTWNKDLRMSVSAIAESISLWVDGEKVLEARDAAFGSGMVGCGTMRASRTLYGPFFVEEL